MARSKKISLNEKKTEYATKRKFPVEVVHIVAVILIATTILTGCGLGEKGGDSGQAVDATATVQADQDLVIPISEISETAKFYPTDIDGTRLEVVAVKASDGTIRTAFNTCQVCYDSGKGYYKQQGDVLVCQNCGNQFSMDRVEVEAGGCNPWPIFDENKTVTDDSITISYDFLKESQGIFSNWKETY